MKEPQDESWIEWWGNPDLFEHHSWRLFSMEVRLLHWDYDLGLGVQTHRGLFRPVVKESSLSSLYNANEDQFLLYRETGHRNQFAFLRTAGENFLA